MPRLAISLIATTLAATALSLAPQPAQACGGTFCDSLPQNPMPVDQNAEDILFVMDGGMVEVHIRIRYEGDAERFAWIVPLQGIPEVDIGSDAMFTWLNATTTPSWTRQREYDCQEDDPSWGDTGDGDGGGDGDPGDGDGDGDGGPMIVLQETVGAFEVVVLQGGTAAEVIDFLAANNYQQDPQAEPILQEYLDEDFLFAAVKLTASADVDEIHPLVFKFPGTEPCVPIRLTAIAAEDDMDIRAYFLGNDPWAPSNYAHVVLNPLAYVWSFPTPTQYQQLVGAAVDEAGGQGFVTEYRGDTSNPPGSVWSSAWNPAAFIGVDPITALNLIAQQGLNQHPLIILLMQEFLPPPMNVDPLDFWNFPEAYADQFDLVAWGDGSGFAAALDERIVQPGLHVEDLFQQWPKLTALHTKMSPVEMTVDPTFHMAPDLPDLGSGDREVTEQVLCGGADSIYHVYLGVEDHPVCVPDLANWPNWDMPAALRIEQVPMIGPPQVTTDNLALINQIWETYDEGVTCMAVGDGDGDGDTGGDGDSDGTGDGDPGDGDGGTADGSGDGTSGPGLDETGSSSCACSTPGGAPLGMGLLLGLTILLPRRRRE